MQRGGKFVTWVAAWTALGTTTTCRECDLPPDLQPPTLFFEGRVKSEAGVGLVAVVTSEQRVSGCDGAVDVVGIPDSTASDGLFRLEHFAGLGLGGCYVLSARRLEGPITVDSVRLLQSDLDAIGDPLGSGVIPVDIILR